MATGLEIKQTRSFRPLKWLLRLLLLGLIIAAGYYALMWYSTGQLPIDLPIAAADPSVNETPISTLQRQDYHVDSSAPRLLTIAKLGLKDARITPIELDKNRQLTMPKYLDDAGWYEESAQPGQDFGAVVIDGHSKGKSRGGIFAQLTSLKAGDTIVLERGDSKKFTYSVYDVRTMSTIEALKSGIPQAMYSVNDTKEGLSIIAESGRFVPKDNDFNQRTILRALRE